MGISGFPDKKTLSQYKGVLVDLDNTLYLHNPCHKAAMQSVFKAHSVSLGTPTYESFKKGYDSGRKTIQARLLPTGSCRSRLLYLHSMLDYLNLSHLPNIALDMERTYVDAFLSEMKLDSEAKKFLDIVKELQIKLCIVTNLTSQFQIQKLKQLGIMNSLHALVTSEEAGVEKPSPLIFEIALEKLKLSKDDVLMIGDDKEKDIVGAQSLGISCVKVNFNE